MRPSRTALSGVTLIELLIVVAMIAIFSAASLATMMAPAEEHAIAETELPIDAGLAAAAAQLISDARASAGIDTRSDKRYAFREAWDGRTVEWFVDDAGRLRRAAAGDTTPAPGTAVVDGVSTFTIGKDADGRWSAVISASLPRLQRQIGSSVTVPLAPAGGVQ